MIPMKKSLLLLIFVPAFVCAQSARMPLVEYFTNTSCTNCPAWTQALDQSLTNVGRANVAVVLVHNANPSPNDPFYQDNNAESNARTSYYAVQGDPDLFVDGTNVSSNSYIEVAIQNEIKQTSSLSIALSGVRNGRSGTVNAAITSTASGQWKLFAVITETGLTYHGTNGEVTHNDVFRTTLTTWSGVDGASGHVSLPFTLGYDDNISSSDSVPWNMDSCRIVVWAQNISTKAVYQAAQIWVSQLSTSVQPTFTFATDDSLLSAPPVIDDIEAVGNIQNISGSTIYVSGVRLVDSLPDGNWTTAVCLAYCGAPSVDTVPSNPLSPNGNQQFLLHFDPDKTPASGHVIMKFYDPNNPSYSVIRQFQFKTNAPTQFLLPKARQTITSNQDTISWKTDLTGKVGLFYSTDNVSWYLIDSVDVGSGSYVWTPGFTGFNFRLKLITSEGSAVSSAFNLQSTAVYEPVPVSYTFVCSPNPANTSVNIMLTGYETKRVTLFDALGRMVYDNAIVEPLANTNIVVNTSALRSGMYYTRVYSASGVFSKPVMVMH